VPDRRILLLISISYLLQILFCYILHPFYCSMKSVLFTFSPKSRNCGPQ